MKIEDINKILKDFLEQNDSYTSVLIDGKWGSGKTTQIRKCLSEIDNNDIVYVSLFGVKNVNELSSCFNSIGKIVKVIGNVASIGLSVIPVVGSGITSALSNVLDQHSGVKKIKKDKIFVFDDLERVDESMSLTSLLGFFNTLMLNNCRVLCLSALDEIKDDKRRTDFDRFVEKTFDRVYHIDESPDEIYAHIFADTGVTNLDEVTEGFEDNIRLAKRTALLFKSADEKAKAIKDKKHDFYQMFTKEQLLLCSSFAIKILYLTVGDISFTEKEKKEYTYFLSEECSSYFGDRISNKFCSFFVNNKERIKETHQINAIICLTRDLMYIEMFNRYDFFIQDSSIVSISEESKSNSLFSSSFYYLNDKDKKRLVDLLTEGLENGTIPVDSALVLKISEICSYSSFKFSKKTIDIIVDEMVKQVENGDNSSYEKVGEQYAYVKSQNLSQKNYLEIIYKKAKQIIDRRKNEQIERELLNAYNSSKYDVLTNTYREFTEGKLFKLCDSFAGFTVDNNFFLPHLEESIDHSQWSFCHQMARYCRSAKIEKKLIDYLRKYINKYPKEKSLKDKATAMIHYNIDGDFKWE